MDIEFIYDTVCPWCYIGKRRIEQAVALRPHVDARLVWRPFLLNREMPSDGIDRNDYLVRKFGSEARVRRIYGAIAQAGQSVDIDFAFDRIDRTPNSVDSHRLVRFAQSRDCDVGIVEDLFNEYFIHGLDIGETDVLVEIGVRAGLPPGELKEYLISDDDIDFVYDENNRAHRMGVNGVPAFVFNGRMVISGAQEPQILARMIDAAQATANAA
ncbi:MAG: DsbA family oxidoreductase [Rhodospirillaceae bacterium]|jgi:predicted DsbA family dithiol-disulfide isomerase|nr:DsbA family oxidoreductase [Rhodospirillaceae bacterium]MBT3910953.1 DsbA family oxidoreductase [Rhodospirillaceae bacterium]MBT5297618.1 DsbA family oxidoreductase [Rhodospirillaceae bacterium]MBT6087348.1 DsbA family oxidoreductase [Rhodospirillaceae bacterium]MBT6608482.1 DsbA family oxidoreductase [Rhodospirillaceae bacterium]